MASDSQLEMRVSELEDRVTRLERGNSGPAESQNPQRVTEKDWQALGSKLDQFEQDLTEKEKAVLLTVLGAAASSFDQAGSGTESPGFGEASVLRSKGNLSKVRLSDGLMSIGKFDRSGVGKLIGNGGNPVADSVNVGGDLTSVHGDWTKDTKMDIGLNGQWATDLLSGPGSAVNVARGGRGGFNG